MTDLPLRRNRDFVLWQAGQLLSTTGTQASTIAYPLLVLAVTHSPALAGVVTFCRVLPTLLFSMPSGVLADRFDRRKLLLLANMARALVIGTMVVLIVTHALVFWEIAAVAFCEGTFSALYSPAGLGALRALVRPEQLAPAVATTQARSAIASLGGPPLGGALFAAGRALPFLVDALSYVFSIVAVLLIRKPLQEKRETDTAKLRERLAEGWRFLWDQPFLRTTTFLYGVTNFIGPGLLLAIIVVSARQGMSSTVTGALLAAFSAGILVGSLVSGFVRRALSAQVIMRLELWLWPLPFLFTIWPNVFVLIASILPAAIAAPVTDSVVVSHRLAATPDRLVGRVESVRTNIALALSPVGSLTAGVLLEKIPSRFAVLVFAAVGVPLAIWGMASATIRNPPKAVESVVV